MSLSHSFLHTKDMDTKSPGRVAKPTTTDLGTLHAELPLPPRVLSAIFQANVTVEIQPWSSDCLGNGCSDPAFRKYMTDLNNNVKPITDFMTKYPKPDLSFMAALASGDICFSDEQVTQSTLLFNRRGGMAASQYNL